MRPAERVIAAALALSILAAIGLFLVYVGGGRTVAEGALLATALGGIGVALLVWARRLMRDIGEQTQPRRHETGLQVPSQVPSEVASEVAAETMAAGVEEMRRRAFLSRMLIAAAGALALAAVIPIRSLGRAPGATLFRTKWRAGARLVDAQGDVVTADTLEVESITTVFPEGQVGSADSQAVLVRVDAGALDLPPDRLAGAPDGLVCYSKICTHAGCPVGLYLAATSELRCPCHQSTFNVLNGAQPVYGPAPRALPQLPIEVDGDGTLRATGDFTEPVGPAFWDLDPGTGQ